MQHNRSLKEISIARTFCRKEDDSDSLCSPKNYFPVQYVPSYSKQNHHLKTTKNSQSQKNLFNFSTISNNPMISPKYQMPLKPQNNNIMTPVNKNLSSHEQPKRPRILSKIRQSNSFSEEFKLGKVLGKGRFGNVCLATHNATGSVYAAKQISLEKVTPKLIERLIA